MRQSKAFGRGIVEVVHIADRVRTGDAAIPAVTSARLVLTP